MSQFKFQGFDGNYTFEGDAKEVKNLKKRVENAVANILAAQEVSVKRTRAANGTRPVSEASKIRAWARENGTEVGTRGRVSAEVKQAYAAAQG